jgi:SAM-dependent methyltransferase
MNLPDIHLCVVQPLGQPHALALIDPARYFRYQFRRLGARVSLSKNRLRHDAINFVFGAHLGFDGNQCLQHTCVFVNLESLGHEGSQVSTAYLQLLRRSAVIDHDPANLEVYTDHPDDVPLVPFVHAPYLAGDAQAPAVPLEERPIDLLVIGTQNERIRRLVKRIEDTGVTVSQFDRPVYAGERDAYICQAKAVLHLRPHDTSRLEPLTLAHCLSLGTPVIGEQPPHATTAAFYEEAACWIDSDHLEAFFQQDFGTPAWFDLARAQLAHFEELDPAEAFADMLAFVSGYGQTNVRTRDPEPWRPLRLNLAAGADYRVGWLNIDARPETQPDLVLDLGQPQALPLLTSGTLCGPVRLEAGQFAEICAGNVLVRTPDLSLLMTQALALLREGGRLVVEVPCEHSPTAWRDPTHLRALNENAWTCYTETFWQLGWFTHRFQIENSGYRDLNRKNCRREKAASMVVVLQKVATTPAERTQARTMSFEVLVPDDTVPAQDQLLPAASSRPLQELLLNEPATRESLLAGVHCED